MSHSLVRKNLFPIFPILFFKLAVFIPFRASFLHFAGVFGHAFAAFHIKVMDMAESFFYFLFTQNCQFAASALRAGHLHFISFLGHADIPPLILYWPTPFLSTKELAIVVMNEEYILDPADNQLLFC
jgi:hypothetical protein